MCGVCGCAGREAGSEAGSEADRGGQASTHVHVHDHVHALDHDHDHDHDHEHDHEHEHIEEDASAHVHRDRVEQAARRVQVEADVLGWNKRAAAANRRWLAERGVVAIDLVSSPGAGKTTLLERTIRDLGGEVALFVIEGDQATSNDADRITRAGAPAIQINTGRGCHLEADEVGRALRQLDPPPGALVLIENVGNLVCPALFDLGEAAKVVLASVAEGDDKPVKYPHMFRSAGLVLLGKVDLLPYVPFSRERFFDGLARTCPDAPCLELSALHGDGLSPFYAWLRSLA